MTQQDREAIGMLSLELALYAEDRYGNRLGAASILTAVSRTLAMLMAGAAKGGVDVDVELVAPLANYLRCAVSEFIRNPPPMSPREILDAYQAEEAGKPWTH